MKNFSDTLFNLLSVIPFICLLGLFVMVLLGGIVCANNLP